LDEDERFSVEQIVGVLKQAHVGGGSDAGQDDVAGCAVKKMVKPSRGADRWWSVWLEAI